MRSAEVVELMAKKNCFLSSLSKLNMFGSWKCRTRGSTENQQQQVVLWTEEDEDILSEIEEELSAFLNRQKAWPAATALRHSKQLPSWMKTASLNRCSRTPPLPPKASKVPTPPQRQRSRTRLGSTEFPISSSTCSPTPPSRRRRRPSDSDDSVGQSNLILGRPMVKLKYLSCRGASLLKHAWIFDY